MILTMPDGSAVLASEVAAITWDKARPGQYGSPACLRIHVMRSKDSGISFNPTRTMEQLHYIPMESDTAAEQACRALVDGWTGRVTGAPQTEPHARPRVPGPKPVA